MQNLLSPTGKMGRMPYIIITVFTLSINYLEMSNIIMPTGNKFIDIIIIITMLFSALLYSFSIIKRLKDIGWSRWLSLLALIPFLSYIFSLILAFPCSKRNSITEETKEPFTWIGFKNRLLQISAVYFYIAYSIYVLIQFQAIYSGAFKLMHNGLGAFFLALFTCYIPLLGMSLGIYGAHIAWKLNWLFSCLLFTAPYLLLGLIYLLIFIIDRLPNKAKQKCSL